jgi:hypothetical protein
VAANLVPQAKSGARVLRGLQASNIGEWAALKMSARHQLAASTLATVPSVSGNTDLMHGVLLRVLGYPQ